MHWNLITPLKLPRIDIMTAKQLKIIQCELIIVGVVLVSLLKVLVVWRTVAIAPLDDTQRINQAMKCQFFCNTVEW